MAYMINNLYNLTLVLLRGCIVTAVVTVVYIIGIIKYERKYILLTKKLEKIKLNNMIEKKNI